MKAYRSFIFGLALAVCAGGMAITPTALPAQDEIQARVTFVLGQVAHIRNGQKKSQIKTNTPLRAGDLLYTGKNGRVNIRYQSHLVKVDPNAKVKVSSAKFPRDNLVMVIYGKIKAESKRKRKKGEQQFKAVTPTSVCAVRGTDFEIEVAENGASTTRLEDGKVNVSSGKGDVPLDKPGIAAHPLGKEPQKHANNQSGRQKSRELLKQEGQRLDKDSEGVAQDYKKENKYFRQSAGKNENATKDLAKSVEQLEKEKAGKQKLEKLESKKKQISNKSENDYYRNELMGKALGNIINGYKKTNKRIQQALFRQIKMNNESIRKLQAQNMKNIRAIDEQFRAKRKAIMESYNKTQEESQKKVDDMRKGLKYDFDKVKPDLN